MSVLLFEHLNKVLDLDGILSGCLLLELRGHPNCHIGISR